MNTYAIRWFLKDVDKLDWLPEDQLKLIQQEFNLIIIDFGQEIVDLDEKVIDYNEDREPRLSAKFALFRLKLPERIEHFKQEFTRINDKIMKLTD